MLSPAVTTTQNIDEECSLHATTHMHGTVCKFSHAIPTLTELASLPSCSSSWSSSDSCCDQSLSLSSSSDFSGRSSRDFLTIGGDVLSVTSVYVTLSCELVTIVEGRLFGGIGGLAHNSLTPPSCAPSDHSAAFSVPPYSMYCIQDHYHHIYITWSELYEL